MSNVSRKSDKEQSRLFEQTARELGADEASPAVDALMGQLAHTRPDPKPKRKTGVKTVKKLKPGH